MQTSDFYFDLPKNLIAQYPLKNRSDARLLVFNRKNKVYGHHFIKDLSDFFDAGDLLVMNNTKVIPARFYGRKESGGKVEILLERLQKDNSFLAHIKASKAPKAGSRIYLDKGFYIDVLAKKEDLYLCQAQTDVEAMLEETGHIPLPPYIVREDAEQDKERYQTVYAQNKGSVAAPTAGLHFDAKLLSALKTKGINFAYSTLHIGAGTFRPVRVKTVKEHKMHAEFCLVDQALCDAVNATKKAKKRVIALGTTAMRSLESAAVDGLLQPYAKDTDIFMYPGYTFKICDALLTNFHLPESTLLMLVAAFIGHKEALDLYQEAIEKQYRFFSYGDACLLL